VPSLTRLNIKKINKYKIKKYANSTRHTSHRSKPYDIFFTSHQLDDTQVREEPRTRRERAYVCVCVFYF
jgi:hypothetical protein